MDFKEKIADLLAKETKQEKAVIMALLTKPPEGMGDFAYPCFALAKAQKKAPNAISEGLAGSISAHFLEKVEGKGPYINFFVKKGVLADEALETIFMGKFLSKGKKKNKIMVEYSAPNTNKPLHVGHLRNGALGLALSNLLEELGNEVVKANLVNDRGVHICKSMLAYKLFAPKKSPESEKKKSDHFVGDMYVLYNKKLEEDSSLGQKAQEMIQQWEKGDKETMALWKKMNKWALDGMKETYKTFGSKFDVWFLESEMFKKQLGKKIVEEGLKKKIFVKEENGAITAMLEPELPNKVLLRGDGTSLYATNDLGVTQEKFDSFKLDQAIWVVANEQDLYFRQLFAIFKKLGRPWASKCFHMSYGMVNLTTGKMKSREGTVVDADDLISEVKELALKEIEERYKNLSAKEKEKRAAAIALGSIKFFLLKNDAKREMLFEPEKSIAFEGETGPYLQYAYARAKSILRKAEEEKIDLKGLRKAEFELLVHEKEKELVVELSKFNSSAQKSWEELSLHPLCHCLLSITEKFNSFYHEVPVLKNENKKEKLARLALVRATTLVLEKGLSILDIEAIEEM